jgi:hypothetical protein
MSVIERWRMKQASGVPRGLSRALAAGALMLSAAFANGQPAPTAPATSSTGSYTVSYAPCGGCVHWLEEKVGDGAPWSYVGQGSVSFSSKPAGKYYYRVAYLEYSVTGAYSYTGNTTYGPQATVVVGASAPAVDSLERQLTYRYEVRRGDLNSDGRIDLFVDRTSGGTAGNGALESVVLLQQDSGRFTVRVPSASQRSAAKSWPVASAKLLLRDVNADGFVDVVLQGVAGAVGSSAAMNQIVYSPAKVLTQAPLGVRSIDSSLKQFARNVHSYLADPQYFVNTAPTMVVTTTYWDIWCTYGYEHGDYTASIPICYSTPYTVTAVVQDYSVFDQQAVSIWADESSIHANAQTRAKGLDSIESTVEKALTVPVGGWDLSGRSGEAGSLDERDYRRGFELFVSLLGIGAAEAQELPRRSDTIYVTGRRIIGWLPFMHTALEYSRSTVSAYDSDRRTLGNGVLVSEKNWVGDLPHLMMTLGTASRASTSPGLYWTQILAADTRYRDNLPYSPTPRAGEGRYNSNGYVHGILRATGGAASVDMNRFTGGNVPVPSSAFN